AGLSRRSTYNRILFTWRASDRKFSLSGTPTNQASDPKLSKTSAMLLTHRDALCFNTPNQSRTPSALWRPSLISQPVLRRWSLKWSCRLLQRNTFLKLAEPIQDDVELRCGGLSILVLFGVKNDDQFAVGSHVVVSRRADVLNRSRYRQRR